MRRELVWECRTQPHLSIVSGILDSSSPHTHIKQILRPPAFIYPRSLGGNVKVCPMTIISYSYSLRRQMKKINVTPAQLIQSAIGG